MKEIDFDWASESKSDYDEGEYNRARTVLDQNRDIFQQSGVTSFWVAIRKGGPYIIVTVEKVAVPSLTQIIPDRIGNYDVYYLAGHLQFQAEA